LNRLLLDTEHALRISPTNPVACTAAATVQYKLADMSWWHRTFVLPNLATEWGRRPSFARSAELFGRAVASAPEVLHLRLWYGKALAADGRMKEARAQWQQAVTFKPLLGTDVQDQEEARRLLDQP
jgi:tetratricopeptide (TPR) repeat protein